MLLRSLCPIGLLHLFSPSIISATGLIAVALSVPVLGEESCDATAADASNGSEDLSRTEDGDFNNVIADDAKSTGEGVDSPVWWDYTIDQMFEDVFDCASITYGYVDDNQKFSDDADPVSEVQLLILRQQWAIMREKYAKEVNLVPIELHERIDDSSNNEINDPAMVRNYGVSQIVVPTRVGDAGPGKGRGVFATQPIPKGKLVADLDNGSTGVFKDGHSWRKFALALPREAACNFIEWGWVQNVPPANEVDDDVRNGLTAFIAFDESNLLNSADWDDVEANIRCGRPPERGGDEWGPCRFHYYAARDIAAGEELLLNYNEFEDEDQHAWTDFGL